MNISKLQDSVYLATGKIPKGKLATYGQIARAIGKPRAARAVGSALRKNPFAPKVPCHRVIRSDGEIGQYAGGQKKKIAMLKKEGIKIRDGKAINLDQKLYCFKRSFL